VEGGDCGLIYGTVPAFAWSIVEGNGIYVLHTMARMYIGN
jgi:hypothetical protein